VADKQAGEEHGKPKPHPYKIQIDKREYEVDDPTPTGRFLLTLAGKVPVDQFGIYLRLQGQQAERIMPDQTVDLRGEGIERFVTLPLDQTEG
jgi:hypothetical protein